MKLKKCLSVILSLILFLNLFSVTNVYAENSEFAEDELWNSCTKNSKGGHEDIFCAGKEADELILSGKKDYVVMKNVGSQANEEIYYFTFRALDKILEELGLDPNEDELKEEWQRLEKERISYFSPLKNILKVCAGGLIGALGGNGLYSLARSERKKHHKDRIQCLRKPVRVISELGVGAMRLIGAASACLIASIFLKIKHDIAEKKEYEIFNKEYKIYKLNSRKSELLNRMLKYIKDSNYLPQDDETIFSVYTVPKDIWRFYPGNIKGLNYTEEEIASFPEKFRKLAQDIEENLGRRLRKYE